MSFLVFITCSIKKITMNDYNLQIAELFLRLFTGILFLFQGYDKLFRLKIPAVTDLFAADAERYYISRPLLNLLAYCSSGVEFLGGLMLIAGFFTNYALYALGVDLLVVSFAFTFLEPMWNMKHVLPRFILVIVILIMPRHYQVFSLDNLLHLK